MLEIVKKIILVFVLTILIFLMAPIVKAEDNIEIWFFHSNGCPHCAQAEPVLEQMAEDNDNVTLYSLELSQSVENQQLFLTMAEIYAEEANGVPTVLIGDNWIDGYIPIEFKTSLDDCLANGCENPSAKMDAYLQGQDISELPTRPNVVDDEDVESQIWTSLVFLGIVGVILTAVILKMKK